MKTIRLLLFASACAAFVCAQDNPLSAELKARYTAIKNNMLKTADKMSDADYAFKPVDTIRTFGGLIGHVADAQAGACGRVKGEQKQLGASAKTAKGELVAALKESFDYCDAVYDSLKDSDLTQMLGQAPRQSSKSAALWGLIVHSNEEYGYLAVYMRLKGVVPPSSDRPMKQ
jgi:uncharacterized damage-inducible protein DinB